MRKWLPILPILLALALTALAYRDLPAVVYPAWGRVLPVTLPDEPMARAGFALLMPLVALGVWGLFAAIARVRGARDGRLPEHLAAAAIERFEPTYHVVVLGVVTLVALLHVALLAATLGWPDWTVQAVGVALGAGLVLVGNLVPRVRPNWIVGIRTPATLRDPDLWLRTHRYFGGLLMVAGLVVIVVAVVAVRWALVALLAGILVAAVLAHWRATRGGSGAVRALALVAAVLLPVRAAAQEVPDPQESAFDECPLRRPVHRPRPAPASLHERGVEPEPHLRWIEPHDHKPDPPSATRARAAVNATGARGITPGDRDRSASP